MASSTTTTTFLTPTTPNLLPHAHQIPTKISAKKTTFTKETFRATSTSLHHRHCDAFKFIIYIYGSLYESVGK
jgi:hypothetical protein